MKNQNKDFSKGFSTIEILISMVVLATTVCAAVMLLWYERVLALETEMSQRALLVAQSYLEKAKGELKEDFFAQVDESANQDTFSISVLSESLSSTVKKISVEVSWPWEFSGSHSLTLDAQVTDIFGSLGADTCATNFFGSWQAPALRGSLSLDLNNLATGVDVMDEKIYVTANGSVAAQKDFFVISGNLDNPSIIGSVNTGPGLNAVHIAGDYAFTANSSIKGQLEIIKISDPNNPVLMQTVKFLSAQTGGTGSSIFYYRGKVYVGTFINAGPEFYVYDVQNPLSPVWLGEFEIGSGVSSIYVYGNYAYIATGDVNRLRVLKIDDPAHITEVADFNDNEMDTVQSGEAVAVLGDKVVFGRAGGLSGAHIPELYLLKTDGQGSINKINSVDANMSVNGIFLRSGLAFLATNKSGGQFQIYNFSNSQLSPYASAPLAADAVGLDCEKENFYLATSGSPALQIISSQ